MKKITSAILTAAILAASGAAAGEAVPDETNKFVPWGNSGDWTIYIDATRGSCFAQHYDADRNVVQMGLTEDKSQQYLGVFVPMTERQKGQEQTIMLKIGDESRQAKVESWVGEDDIEYTGTYLLGESLDYARAAGSASQVVVYPDQSVQVTMSLDGSEAAMAAAMECTSQL